MPDLRATFARLFSAALAALTLLTAIPKGAAAADPDYAVTGGWFYGETGSGTGKGFNLLDSGTDNKGQITRFYSEFNRLGGVPVLGYPASTVFLLPDGFIYQATQASLMQWRPADAPQGDVQLANTFDLLSQTGHDKDLLTLGIPTPIKDDGSGGDFQKATDTRLGWLTQADIKAKFMANPNPSAIPTWGLQDSIQLYGLPTSMPQRFGPFVVQRFQRVAFQLWVDNVAGMPAPGSVVPILGGDLAKRFSVVPAAAQQPQPPASSPQTSFLVQTVPALAPAVQLLTQYDQEHNSTYMRNLAVHNTAVILAPIADPNALGFFSPGDNVIRISNRVSNEDVHDLADLISHESSHALDFWTGVDIISEQGCYDTEIKAFRHQADVWSWFYPNLKPAPTDALDQFLNSVVRSVSSDPTGFVSKLTQAYHHQCAATPT
ncbi:MAG TPA: hypothetical protein VFS62_10870 [Chloroflexota bacterium]|nr:hypothetical protein [Chloroflexota bacterium]